MNRTIARWIPPLLGQPIPVIVALLTIAMLDTRLAQAQSGGAWEIVSSTLDAGGLQAANGGAFMLKGTTGQPDAGVLSGGSFRLDGGFWRRGLSVLDAPTPPPSIISNFFVHPAFPNPTRASCAVAFDLPEEREVRAQVFDVNGRLVRTLVHGVRPAGRHVVNWDGTETSGASLSNGLYFVRVRAGADQRSSRVVRMGDRGGFR